MPRAAGIVKQPGRLLRRIELSGDGFELEANRAEALEQRVVNLPAHAGPLGDHQGELMPDLVWFVTRRLLATVLVMLALSLAVYLIFYALPADPARLGCGKPCTPDRLEQARHFMQLDQSTMQQYLQFLKGIVAGRTFGEGTAAVHCNAPCFGYSFPLARPVTTLIMGRLPVTASIATIGPQRNR